MNKKISLSTTHIILLSFLIVILIGSILLSFPISSKNGSSAKYIDALFTATTSTCVTGLVTVPTYSTWSFFGQIVILILIQIGGLGVVAFMSAFMIILHKKLKLKDYQLIQDAFNLNTMSGLKQFIKHVFLGTLLIELVGAILYMFVFIPDYGIKGVWISVFNSVSAFCNAGIDVIGEVSLCDYATNPLINITTSLLIVLGGLGFIVWWDVLRVLKQFKNKKFKCFKSLTLHSKIVITSTLALIFGGALLVFLFEYNNVNTIANFNIFDKIQISMFQSITTRTAGFATIPQEYLTDQSVIVCLILMFIGGSPVGTAGGIKTITAVSLIAIAIASILNKKEVVLFNRNLSSEITRKAVAVTAMSFMIVIISTILLSLTIDRSIVDILYETVSATATVGLSRNLTPYLKDIGKFIIIITMYLGRVGPISLAIAFKSKKASTNIILNPTEEVSIG
ncbi:MAG: potassium transporter KtrB [Bacilli bacterium]|nr:potassium transporter KtrB [Bacilli bacterium]